MKGSSFSTTPLFDKLGFDFLRDIRCRKRVRDATGELRIGAGPAHFEGIVLIVIAQLFREYPRMIFYVAPLVTPPIYEALRQRRIEFGLVRISVALSEGDLGQEFFFEEPLVVIATRCGRPPISAGANHSGIDRLREGQYSQAQLRHSGFGKRE